MICAVESARMSDASIQRDNISRNTKSQQRETQKLSKQENKWELWPLYFYIRPILLRGHERSVSALFIAGFGSRHVIMSIGNELTSIEAEGTQPS